MTYNRPGVGTHVVNDTGGDLTHNQPAELQGFVGVLVKQKNVGSAAGLISPAKIANGEKCWMITTGIVQVDTVAGFAKGDPVHINATTNVLTETAAGAVPFGRVVEVVGDGRGVPAGKVRINLNEKGAL